MENRIVRPGSPQDALAIAELLMLAMEKIVYQFIGEENKSSAYQFLSGLVKEAGNQYSYQNAWVYQHDDQIIGVALVYDGSRLGELRLPVAKRINELFNRPFSMEPETQTGEFYVDCLAVNPEWQGKGIGSLLLNHLTDHFVRHEGQVLGLLVDVDNPRAKHLYERLGFRVVGQKSLFGERHEHMQCSPMHRQDQ